MKNIKLALAIIATLFVLETNAQTAQEVQVKFNEAASAYNAKDFTKAIPLFEETISMEDMAEGDASTFIDKSKKFLYMSYLNAGKIFASKKDFVEAIKYFKGALGSTTNIMEKNTSNKLITQCYLIMTNNHIKQGNMAAAADIAYQGYSENERDYKIGILAAQCYSKAGNYEKSQTIYNAIIKLGETPRFVNAAKDAKASAGTDFLAASVEAVIAKDYTKALELLNITDKYVVNNPTALMARMQIYNDTKRYSEVTKYGQKAIEAQPNAEQKANAAFYVAIAYQELGDKAKAIKYYKQVTEGANAETAVTLIEQLSK